jgi:hypothetical protein
MAEFVKEQPGVQRRDTLGLLAGFFFAAVGLTYLIDGSEVVSDNWGLVLPGLLVVIGAAGLLSSGLVRAGVRRSPTAEAPQAASAEASAEADVPAEAPVEADAAPESAANPDVEPEI